MHLFFLSLWLLGILPLVGFAQEQTENPRPTVLVTIAPYKFFVEAIADDTVHVQTLVPPAASFHTFEPTPRQMLDAAKADIWFRVGESFESRVISALQAHHPQMQIVDLRQGIDLITFGTQGEVCAHCIHESGADLHIWLSPKQAKIQAQKIAQALMTTYPAHREEYQKRLNALLNSLDLLDKEMADLLLPLHNRTIMVSHAAYAYLARDYGLTQLAIEFEGHEPTQQQLMLILVKAKEANVHTIFAQKQYSIKGASLIAKHIGAKVVLLDPYSDEYFAAMRDIAQQIAQKDMSIDAQH